MPVGIPPSLSALGHKIQFQIEEAIIYFEIPAFNEVTDSFQLAMRDCIVAFQSTSRLLQITFRPVLIFLALISRYLYIVLQIITRHTIRHAIVGLRELLHQLIFGTKEFIRFQKSLPPFWIGVELGFCALFVTAYLLRRLIKKRRYVERVTRWYRGKKRRVHKKYNEIVRRISQTSVTLALLLPHILFVMACIGVKYFSPSVIQYVANKTYVTEFISLWYPLYKTVGLISFKKIKTNTKEKENIDGTLKMKSTKGNVADRWIIAASASAPSSKNPTSSASTAETVNAQKSNESKKDKSFDFDEEASLLLRYWVVYGFTYSIMRMIILLPFIGSYISTTIAAIEYTDSSIPHKYKWLSYISPSPFFFAELRLMFFLWLKYLPTSSSNEYGSKMKAASMLHDSPLQIVYSRLSPLALRLVKSSSYTGGSKNNNIDFITSKLVSILDLAVLIKLISNSTKQIIITIASESTSLLPACITFFMPSKFAAYGCIYSSAIIPAAHSVDCEISINGTYPRGLLRGSPEYIQAKKDRLRFLKYWVLQSLLILFMDTFLYSFLLWVPFSTHMTLVVWILLNLPLGGTNMAYEYLEYELVAFGLLEWNNIQNYDVNKTLTVRMIKRVSSSLPVAKDVNVLNSENTTNDAEKSGKKL